MFPRREKWSETLRRRTKTAWKTRSFPIPIEHRARSHTSPIRRSRRRHLFSESFHRLSCPTDARRPEFRYHAVYVRRRLYIAPPVDVGERFGKFGGGQHKSVCSRQVFQPDRPNGNARVIRRRPLPSRRSPMLFNDYRYVVGTPGYRRRVSSALTFRESGTFEMSRVDRT